MPTLQRAVTNRTARRSFSMHDGAAPRSRACLHRRRTIPAREGDLFRPDKRRRMHSPPVTRSMLTPPVIPQMPDRVSVMMLPPPMHPQASRRELPPTSAALDPDDDVEMEEMADPTAPLARRPLSVARRNRDRNRHEHATCLPNPVQRVQLWHEQICLP